MTRSTREVLQSHLDLRSDDDTEGDIASNYSEDVVILTWGEGAHHGHDGVRKMAEVLAGYVSAGAYEYDLLVTEDAYGLLRWAAHGEDVCIHDGTDGFVVRDGLIVAHTIAYNVVEGGH